MGKLIFWIKPTSPTGCVIYSLILDLIFKIKFILLGNNCAAAAGTEISSQQVNHFLLPKELLQEVNIFWDLWCGKFRRILIAMSGFYLFDEL